MLARNRKVVHPEDFPMSKNLKVELYLCYKALTRQTPSKIVT